MVNQNLWCNEQQYKFEKSYFNKMSNVNHNRNVTMNEFENGNSLWGEEDKKKLWSDVNETC